MESKTKLVENVETPGAGGSACAVAFLSWRNGPNSCDSKERAQRQAPCEDQDH
jgi:hypothetical protein